MGVPLPVLCLEKINWFYVEAKGKKILLISTNFHIFVIVIKIGDG